MRILTGKKNLRAIGRNENIADDSHQKQSEITHHQSSERLFLTFHIKIQGNAREKQNVGKINGIKKISKPGLNERFEEKRRLRP